MTTPWAVPKDWEGETVAVLASGPSMSMKVAETVRGRCRVVAVNNQAIPTTVRGVTHPALAPWADMLYASDVKWWREYETHARKFEGLKVTVRTVLEFDEVLSLEQSTNVPFDERPTHVVTGGNSGYAAVHVAAQKGARRILLCGFDLREVHGLKHWFGDHPGKLNSPQQYKTWRDNLAGLGAELKRRGIEVLNCTPSSALPSLRYVDLEEALRV